MTALRTVTLPTALGATWDDFQWPSKAPADRLRYTLDCAAWLADAGEIIQRVSVSCSQGLTLRDVEFNQGDTAAVLHITDGAPGTVAVVQMQLTLTGDDVLNVWVALPITVDVAVGLVPAWPPVEAFATADADGRTADSSALTADAAPAGAPGNGPTNTADQASTSDTISTTADAA